MLRWTGLAKTLSKLGLAETGLAETLSKLGLAETGLGRTGLAETLSKPGIVFLIWPKITISIVLIFLLYAGVYWGQYIDNILLAFWQ